MHALSVNMLLLAPLLSFAQAGYTIANTITFDPASTRVNVLNYDNSNPLDTFYVRKGLIIGHKLGYMNESFAAQNANRTTMNPRDIDAVEDVSFNFSLNVDLGTTIIIGAVACFFFQSCLAWAVQKLVSAGVTSLQAGGVGITVTENGAAAKFKRETAQFESFACEYAVSDIYCTDESDYTTQALSMMSQHDIGSSSASSGSSSTSWTMSSTAGETLARYWHCISENDYCSFTDGGPTNLVQVGNEPGDK